MTERVTAERIAEMLMKATNAYDWQNIGISKSEFLDLLTDLDDTHKRIAELESQVGFDWQSLAHKKMERISELEAENAKWKGHYEAKSRDFENYVKVTNDQTMQDNDENERLRSDLAKGREEIERLKAYPPATMQDLFPAATIDQVVASARSDALEEAAKVCDGLQHATTVRALAAAYSIAAKAIRAPLAKPKDPT